MPISPEHKQRRVLQPHYLNNSKDFFLFNNWNRCSIAGIALLVDQIAGYSDSNERYRSVWEECKKCRYHLIITISFLFFFFFLIFLSEWVSEWVSEWDAAEILSIETISPFAWWWVADIIDNRKGDGSAAFFLWLFFLYLFCFVYQKKKRQIEAEMEINSYGAERWISSLSLNGPI